MTTATIEHRPPLVSVDDVAERTGLDPATIRLHLDRGDWPGVRVGRRGAWRIPAGVIDALLVGNDPAGLRAPARAG